LSCQQLGYFDVTNNISSIVSCSATIQAVTATVGSHRRTREKMAALTIRSGDGAAMTLSIPWREARLARRQL
jgi:hypothetical protein